MTDKPLVYAERRMREILGDPPEMTNLYAHDWKSELEMAFGRGLLMGLEHDQALLEKQAAQVKNAQLLVAKTLKMMREKKA